MPNLTPNLPHDTEQAVPDMDPVAVERWLAMPIQQSPWLHEEVGSRMAQRLSWIKAVPGSWLDWEPVRGGVRTHHEIAAHLGKADAFIQSIQPVLALDVLKRSRPKVGLLSRWWGGGPRPIGAQQQVQMVWANMILHTTHRPQSLVRQWHSHLMTDGFLMFSCLGPDTLQELRRVYQACGWSEPGHPLTDMHDWGDMLVHQGFAEPVMDAEHITLTYATVDSLLADLRTLGRNVHPDRTVVAHTKSWIRHLRKALEEHLPRTSDGQMRLTFEVIYGHAYKPKPRIRVAGSNQVPLQDMRSMLGIGQKR